MFTEIIFNAFYHIVDPDPAIASPSRQIPLGSRAILSGGVSAACHMRQESEITVSTNSEKLEESDKPF